MKKLAFSALFLMGVSQASLAASNFLEMSLAQRMGTSDSSQSPPHRVETQLSDPFFKNHALVFFFSSQCPFCQQFAPVVKQWAASHTAPTLALSFDNQPLGDFPDFIPVTTQWVNEAYAGKPITYPALFIANKISHLLYPVAYGAMTAAELDLRLSQLKTKIQAYESRSPSA